MDNLFSLRDFLFKNAKNHFIEGNKGLDCSFYRIEVQVIKNLSSHLVKHQTLGVVFCTNTIKTNDFGSVYGCFMRTCDSTKIECFDSHLNGLGCGLWLCWKFRWPVWYKSGVVGLCCLGCLGVFYGAYHIGEITLILGTFFISIAVDHQLLFCCYCQRGRGWGQMSVPPPLINHKWL